MALVKTPIPINFAKGINNKADPYQLAFDSFTSLQNSVFDKLGRLTKRNGYGKITQLPNATQTAITTLNGNLLATGSNLYAYSKDTSTWLNQGPIQPVTLETQAILRSATSQSAPDTAIAVNGLTCLTYVDQTIAYYQVSDSTTGQQIVNRTTLPATATNPRAFVLGNYFIITFIANVAAVPHLQYVAVPIANPGQPKAAVDISVQVASLTTGYDAFVANGQLYVAWSSTANLIRIAYVSQTLILSADANVPTHTASLISVTADTTASTTVVWLSFYDTGVIYTTAYNQVLTAIKALTTVAAAANVVELTTIASNMSMTALFETQNTYTYAPNARTDFVSKVIVPQVGAAGVSSIILRSVGLASKLFYAPTGIPYVIVTYGEQNQPTYFLIDLNGNLLMRLAYANGGGYASSQVIPSVTYLATTGQFLFPYLLKDFLATVNKTTTSTVAGEPVNAIYTQTGVNLAKFSINLEGQYSAEIADALHLTGGQLWEYDGVLPVENGFHVWPENVAGTTSATGGTIGAGNYLYSFTYEWTDNQGNLHRSAPSIPIKVITAGATSSNTLNIPTLRLTYKVGSNPVRIVGYRWSAAQPVFYQFTSITSPVLNNTTIDSVTIVDTVPDSAILGQTILYTTGGVVENIAPPACSAITLFKNRLFIVDAENRNLIWYSKQLIQNVPVEMSDLFTIYVAPTTGSQGSTGPITALSSMDDKLIVFKKDAIYYLTGTGPDNTGANNDFNDPVFITSSVGCANPDSIVLTPMGLMFQSDKGIWLLGKDLGTIYIGAQVEDYNNEQIQSAKVIPGSNRVLFLLSSGTTLMFDYFYSQWGTFTNLRAISSTLYQGAHTYLNTTGEVFQETPGAYLDGSKPVLMSLTTAWISIAGLQGFERFYQLYLLGTSYTPFKLNVGLAYDYNESTTQQTMVAPDKLSQFWGGESVWGGGTAWGGTGNVFEARVFPQTQKCSSFQISIDEQIDNASTQPSGQGLTLSGLNIVVGSKKGYRTQSAKRSFG